MNNLLLAAYLLKIPSKHFRVVCSEAIEEKMWVQGDYPTLEEAVNHANEAAGGHTDHYIYNASVYNDMGKEVHKGKTKK